MLIDKVILVHNGALGDFLTAWPALWSLHEAWPEPPMLWAGREAYLPWVTPLGCTPCPPLLKEQTLSLYSREAWPDALRNALVVWFGLARRSVPIRHERLWFLQGLAPLSFQAPGAAHAEALRIRGVAPDPFWPVAWERLFGRWVNPGSHDAPVLLFPGAGHRSKEWPLVQFLALAARLQQHGLRPEFVLGPAEADRGVRIADYPVRWPMEPHLLAQTLLSARCVVGCDSGPMHLAGMYGVPGIVLFGPTSEKQWGPHGMRILSAPLPCRPCAANPVDIVCESPRCMQGIEVAAVEEAVWDLVSLDNCSKKQNRLAGALDPTSRFWQKQEG